MRLTAASAVFYVATAPLGYWLYLRYGRTGRLMGGPLPWALWLVPIGLVVCPVVLGLTLGSATRRGRPWTRLNGIVFTDLLESAGSLAGRGVFRYPS